MLDGHAHNWWESYIETLRLEGELSITKWEVIKTILEYQLYPTDIFTAKTCKKAYGLELKGPLHMFLCIIFH